MGGTRPQIWGPAFEQREEESLPSSSSWGLALLLGWIDLPEGQIWLVWLVCYLPRNFLVLPPPLPLPHITFMFLLLRHCPPLPPGPPGSSY